MRRRLLALDLVAVLAFVLLGRRTHDEAASVAGYLETAAPFLIGLLLGWLAARAWDRPAALITGAVVWASTYTVGLLLRRFVWDESTAFAFVLVAGAFLAVFLFGWRLGARFVAE